MEVMRVGPMKPTEGRIESKWDEIGHNRISHIIVTYDYSGLTAIQFGYVENGTLLFSKTYGTLAFMSSTRIVRLNPESEFVTGISGEASCTSITSLTFHTNEKKHEVFHKKSWWSTKIEFHLGILDQREFGGFFGSCNGDRLYSIGLYLKPFLPDVKTIKHENV